jgi:lipopolysaccharide transport system ATP-binding protein
MSDVAIHIEQLGKLYRLGEREPYKALRDVIATAFSAPFRSLTGGRRQEGPGDSSRYIWALKDISLEIKQGEVVGIIGRNGAGKTTLLKVLSRVTEPTRGWARVWGRVGSLLEVGTGFHPELTGGENIYLNGAILGMRRAEIARKFDDIVSFAELESFIDTPVKRYSTGMFMRLAFAVAAFLEPEILMVDEVLAVGDVAFQQRCLGKMGEVARDGRTVLLISHNLAAISNLCSVAYLLDKGEIVTSGPPQDVIQRYLEMVRSSYAVSLRERRDRRGDGQMRLTGVSFRDKRGKPLGVVACGQDVEIWLSYEAANGKPLHDVVVGMPFFDAFGQTAISCGNELTGQVFESLPPRGEIVCCIPRLPLYPGRYDFNLQARVNNAVIADWLTPAGELTVVEGDFYGTGRLPAPSHRSLLVAHSWRSAQGES